MITAYYRRHRNSVVVAIYVVDSEALAIHVSRHLLQVTGQPLSILLISIDKARSTFEVLEPFIIVGGSLIPRIIAIQTLLVLILYAIRNT